MNVATQVLAIFVGIISGIWDLKEKRIPNIVSLPTILIGIVVNIYIMGCSGVPFSFLGILGGMITMPLYILGIMGAGDVKLFMALGSLLGFKLIVVVTAASFMFGGIIGVFVLIFRKNHKRRLLYLYRYLWIFAVTKKFTSYDIPDEESDAYFSFGTCIAVGIPLGIFMYKNNVFEIYTLLNII